MFAGVLATTVKQSVLDEGRRYVSQLFNDVVFPFLRETPEYRGAITLFDRGLGTVTAVVFFETEAEARFLDQGGDEWKRLFERIGPERLTQLADLLTEPIRPRSFSLVAHDITTYLSRTDRNGALSSDAMS